MLVGVRAARLALSPGIRGESSTRRRTPVGSSCMARKERSDPIPNGGLEDGLRHSPFAALRPRVPAADPGVIPVTDAMPAPPLADAMPATPARRDPPPAPAPRSVRATPSMPAEARIVVRRERKGHGGKSVTIAEGPGLVAHDLEALARAAARALGAGARVESGALVVQGEQTERLIAWLGARGIGSVVRGN